ncbi:hypothetical protein [Rhodococcus indonesiensis]|uniref:hypothetical protein n=1 Tax=Rhodococcus indonesiensis TaxID=3055869 RepID=UPI0039F7060D
MPTLIPTLALTTTERALRQLYTQVFGELHGSGWLTDLLGEDQVKRLVEKRDVEAKRREERGVAETPTSLVEYTEFFQLVSIADKNWHHLAPALGEKKDTLALIRRFEQLRNTVAHSRELLPFEEDLLSGIAGEIRNRVTFYMSKTTETNEYWARIESITDSYGNSVDGLATTRSSNPGCLTGQTLRVGEVVTFDCRASDPKGRKITWKMAFLPSAASDREPEAVEGDDVRLKWEVQPHHVSSQSSVHIRMTSDSPSHRWQEGVDGMALFYYTVLPAE